jgi:hypothetical protein
MPNSSESWDSPDSEEKTQEQKQVDRPASPRVSEIMGDEAAFLTRHINRTQDNRREKSYAIGGDIHQEPGSRDENRASSIGVREKNRYSGRFWRRDWICAAVVLRIGRNL